MHSDDWFAKFNARQSFSLYGICILLLSYILTEHIMTQRPLPSRACTVETAQCHGLDLLGVINRQTDQKARFVMLVVLIKCLEAKVHHVLFLSFPTSSKDWHSLRCLNPKIRRFCVETTITCTCTRGIFWHTIWDTYYSSSTHSRISTEGRGTREPVTIFNSALCPITCHIVRHNPCVAVAVQWRNCWVSSCKRVYR